MATKNSTSTLKRADHPVRLTGTPNWHYAAMRRAQDAAGSMSVRLSVRGVVDGFAGVASDDELAALKAHRDSLYLLAAAHRGAARRLERGERLRIRVERVVRPVVRLSLRLRRVVSA